MSTGFTKVEGLGNDFILIDSRAGVFEMDAARAAALCDRHLGIGADGVLILRPSAQAAAQLDIWNSDGSRSEMCGNGLRCAAQELFKTLGREEIRIQTLAGLHRCRPADGGLVWVELVGLSVGPSETLQVDGRSLEGRVVRLGNPHFVTFDLPLAAADTLGPALEHHPRFAPQRTNVELCAIEAGALRVRVWERGAGLTLACGTGAGAAAAAAWAAQLLPQAATQVSLPGGKVEVQPLAADRLGLLGPARAVFEGRL